MHSILEADENIDIVWGSGIDISEEGEYISESLTLAKKAFPNGYRGTIDNCCFQFLHYELSYVIRRDLLLRIMRKIIYKKKYRLKKSL